MSVLRLYFAPGLFRNFWHSLLLVPALFLVGYVMVGLVFSPVTYLPISLLMLGIVVLALLCIRNASGPVRYWSLFLWLGLFLMAAATFCLGSASKHQLFNVLAFILLLVFFWSLGRFDWRVIVPLLLFCGAFTGVVFYPAVDSFNVPLVKAFVCLAGFLVLFCLNLILAFSAKELPGFRWLASGLSLAVLIVVTMPVFLIYFAEYVIDGFIDGWFLAFVGCTQMLSLLCIAVGTSIFTLKMDPAQLEERLRKATPAKEVESVN